MNKTRDPAALLFATISMWVAAGALWDKGQIGATVAFAAGGCLFLFVFIGRVAS